MGIPRIPHSTPTTRTAAVLDWCVHGMGPTRGRRIKRLAWTTAVWLVPMLSQAAPIVYTGYDVGGTSLAASPSATAAAAAFDLATGPLPVIDFESGLPSGVGLSNPHIVAASTCLTVALHCYATSGTMVAVNNFELTFTFATPVDSFGAYFTGWQLSDQTITYMAGSVPVVLNMGAGDFDSGGTRFFGFSDVGASITSVTYNGLSDFIGIDDLRYGTAVPEACSIVLLGLGLAMMVGQRRVRSA
jgi:hypothetical protein